MANDNSYESERSLTEVLQDQVRAERQLSRRLAEFRGRWVGVRDHTVVADAESLEKLVDLLDDDTVEFVLEVPEKRAPAAFF